MALSLTAEQKSIFEIFSGKNQYIIPPYQRPYSWDESQCVELFEDLVNAFDTNKSEGYFLGNIVIAKSNEERNMLEVVDGQQRLTTLTLFMNVLLHFDKESEDLANAITIPGGRKSEKKKKRLKTNNFIEKDTVFLKKALNIDFNEGFRVGKKDNRFIKNTHYFFNEIKSFIESNNDIQDFIDFFMYDVSLLPIQTEDTSPEKAREKALKIFETINNRGLSLSDSDIFKASLYSKALSTSQHDDFIQKWKALDEECQSTKYSINDIFRFYTQVVRGKEGIKTTEIGLREFFTQRAYSPFNKVSYSDVLDDLFKVIEAIKFFNSVIETPEEYGELTKWFQLINEYTNQYPLNALLVYLISNDLNKDDNLICFSKNLVRYAYFHGASVRIKFFIFDLIIKVSNAEKVKFEFYPENIPEDHFEYFGNLKKSYSLLCLYLNSEQEAIFPYYFNKIIHARNVSSLNASWDNLDYGEYADRAGNMIVVDRLIPRDTRLDKKATLLGSSSIPDVKVLSNSLSDWSYDAYTHREEILQKRLESFFRKNNES